MKTEAVGPGDVTALCGIAERLAVKLYPELRREDSKIRSLFRQVSIPSGDFARIVRGPSGAPAAVLIGITADNLWAQRRRNYAMIWYSEIPMAGVLLLREYRDWVRANRAIRVAGFSIDCDTDDRVDLLLKKVGFVRRGSSFVLFN